MIGLAKLINGYALLSKPVLLIWLHIIQLIFPLKSERNDVMSKVARSTTFADCKDCTTMQFALCHHSNIQEHDYLCKKMFKPIFCCLCPLLTLI